MSLANVVANNNASYESSNAVDAQALKRLSVPYGITDGIIIKAPLMMLALIPSMKREKSSKKMKMEEEEGEVSIIKKISSTREWKRKIPFGVLFPL